MKVIFSLLALLAATEAVSLADVMVEEWNLFKLKYNKTYDNDAKDQFRMKIFMDNKNKIAKHNSLFVKGLVPFKLEMNHYGDMLHHEFVSTMNGFKRSKANSLSANIKPSYYIEPANVEFAKTVDWRTEGAVTPVKDQGHCGSCWSFSSNLIDCSGKYGNEGCNGGLMDNAFKYIKDNHGLDTEQSYPYEAVDGICRYLPDNSGATDSGFVDIPEGDEDKLMAAVATVGPVSVAIDASHLSFSYYGGGVYYEPECSSTDLDHAVLVVGYGTEGGEDYWQVKNSWGEGWGDEGYIKMSRNKNNNCGIASSASYPLV